MTKGEHRIDDVRFSELWCQCTCGVEIRSETQAAMPDDWSRHRREAGEATRSLSTTRWADPAGVKNRFNPAEPGFGG